MVCKIMLSCSMRGGRELLLVYKKIVELLSLEGFEFVTTHQIEEMIFEKEKSMTNEEIYQRDVSFIKEADFIIAEITKPSLGVGAEIVIAKNFGKPVLCLYDKNGPSISEFILGMDGLVKEYYSSVEDIVLIVKNFALKLV